MSAESPRLLSNPFWQDALPGKSSSCDADRLVVDVAVIGGGLTGLSAAYHLLQAQPGLRVVVLEAEQLGYGASSRSTGMLTPGVGQNVTALVRRFGPEAARRMYQASLQAVEYVREITASEGIDAELDMAGQLIVADGRSGRRRLSRQADALAALGLPCQRLDTAQLSERLRIHTDAPGGEEAGPAALWLPIAGTLHPGRLVDGLAKAVRRREGLIVEDARVLSISRGAPVRIELAGGRNVTASSVVVASSGYASALGLQRGRVLPLHLRVLLTDPLTSAQRTDLGWQGREGVIDSRRLFNYFRLTSDDRILFGGGRPRYLWGGRVGDQPAAGPDLERLTCEFRRRFPNLKELSLARSWTGVIGYTLDALPVIGYVPGYERVLFVGGWCGHGIALSTLSGRWVQELLLAGRSAMAFPWFRRRAPLAPLEPVRWLAARTAVWSMEAINSR